MGSGQHMTRLGPMALIEHYPGKEIFQICSTKTVRINKTLYSENNSHLGAMQAWIPYHKAVDETTFGEGEQYQFELGVQNNTYAKDLFDIAKNGPVPVCPALKLKSNLDGTSTPSFEGIQSLKPKV